MKLIENNNDKLSITIQNSLQYNFEIEGDKHALSEDQIKVSEAIFRMFKDRRTPRLIQLISQPQTGKTNTILNICGLINNFSLKNPNIEDRASIIYFQPSDNALKDQLRKRFENAKYWSQNNPQKKYNIIDIDARPFKIYTPSNINGLNEELTKKIDSLREDNRSIIFIHDESHRDINGKAHLPKFYEKNNIFLMPFNRDQYDRNNSNKTNEIYINISASPSSFVEYVKKDNHGSYVTYYLKPHKNYLSFKDIHEKGRFKKGFSFSDKKSPNSIDKFVINILCENFLLQNPGCFIVRLGKGNGSKNSDIADKSVYASIKNKIKSYLDNPQTLIDDLNKFIVDVNLKNKLNFNKIISNIQKIRTVLFSSTAENCLSDQIRNNNANEFELVNNSQYDHLKIEDMELFLSNRTQNESFKLLFIMDSFLQGKTLHLDNVRGWFERYNEDAFNNNAFTIQSVGRNCGPYKNKNFKYPIWVNLEEIRHIINFYDEIETSIDSDGLVDSSMWQNENNRNKMAITNTYVKSLTKKALNKQFAEVYDKEFSSYEYEADVFVDKKSAIQYLKDKMKNAGKDLESICVQIRNAQEQKNNSGRIIYNYDLNDFSNFKTSVSKHEAKNAISDIILKNYGRYAKTTTGSKGYIFGIIEIDGPNELHIEAWNEYVLNNKSDSILLGKQNHYVAYISRIDIEPLSKVNSVKDCHSAIAISQKKGN